MVKYSFKLAARNFRKQKTHTIINIVGLAIAIACCILIFLYIESEFSYDSFHANSNRIYQALLAANDEGDYWGASPSELAEAARHEIAEIEDAVRYSVARQLTFRINGRLFENDCSFADPNFFGFFDFPVITGNAKAALEETNSLLISEKTAEIYFSEKNPIGRVISIKLNSDGFEDFVVRGIFKNVPDNSSMKFDYVMPYSRTKDYFRTVRPRPAWGNIDAATFFLVKENASIAGLRENLAALADRYNVGSRWNSENIPQKIDIRKITDIHFSSSVREFRLEAYSDQAYSYILGGIGLLIIIVACINSTNIFAGLSAWRAKEVGVRKVFGATRRRLITQFEFEAVILCFIALILGIMLSELLLPTFNSLTDRTLGFNYGSITTMLVLVGIFLLTGLLSGIYPSLIFSKFSPAAVFRKKHLFVKSYSFTKILIFLQFSLSVFLIVCTLFMSKQFRFMNDLDHGFNPDGVVKISISRGITEAEYELFRNRITAHSNIVSVAGSHGFLMGDERYGFRSFEYNDKQYRLPYLKIDYDFMETAGLELTAGRNFSRQYASDDRNAVIVNESYLKEFRIKDPVGKQAPMGGEDLPVIIGVVRDFNFESLREPIKPMAFHRTPEWNYHEILIKLGDGNPDETAAFMENAWSELFPDIAFFHAFLHEEISNQYHSEQIWGSIIKYASYLAVFIACLGLFGLTSLSTVHRTKEMGIRKILGASSAMIIMHFNKELISIILLANIPAWFAAYYVMTRWLQNFSYKTPFGAGIFILSALLSAGVAVITISVLAAKTATTNPVQTLRHE